MTLPAAAEQLKRVRRIALGLPEAAERPSHGSPAFFIGNGKQFVHFHDDHHSDGRLAIWCAAPEGMQGALIESAPEHYFVPPYVGHRGWLGVHLDRGISEDELAGVIEDAYLAVAPRKLADRLARPE
ncbi:MAG: MmcQ/YjbR family DNA-binding protein [Actinomycetota bacterium]|nr:MmcQ/YjbR family DNA-binding protein [Actinomycetota bacterium]